jgi:hypothetical protein
VIKIRRDYLIVQVLTFLKEAETKLWNQNNELNEAYKKLKELDEMKVNFLSSVSMS